MNGHAVAGDEAQRASRQTVEEARSGSDPAWRELFDAHYPKLAAYFRSRVDSPETAEDLAAEVFVEAYRSLGRFQWRNRPFGAWMFGIARNRLAMHYRRQRPQTAPLEDVEHVRDDYLEVEIRDVLQRLPADYRAAIEHRYVVGLSGAEAAAAMGRSHGSFRALLMRATQAFKREYGGEG